MGVAAIENIPMVGGSYPYESGVTKTVLYGIERTCLRSDRLGEIPSLDASDSGDQLQEEESLLTNARAIARRFYKIRPIGDSPNRLGFRAGSLCLLGSPIKKPFRVYGFGHDVKRVTLSG